MGAMPPRPDDALWRRLEVFSFGAADHAALSFADRLAREAGWDKAHAVRVLDEYRKYLYLACVADHEVTPSGDVDQAWHLHLIYSRDYWDRLCAEVLKRPLHHNPTAGGGEEQRRYRRNYEQTLLSYRSAFGPPPVDIWPAADIRFSQPGQRGRIDSKDFWIIPKPAAVSARPSHLAVLGGVVAVLTACTMSSGQDALPLEVWLMMAGVGVLFAVIGLLAALRHNRKPRRDPPVGPGGRKSRDKSEGDPPMGCAGCAG